MSQFPVNVVYNSSQGLQVQPDRLVVAKGLSGKIVWTPQGQVEEITSIVIGDNWPGSQPQADSGADTWSVEDANQTAGTYKYTVQAKVTGQGDKELDPEIVNRGSGG